MSLLATCHCGATRIEVPGSPATAKECNCTYCYRTGAVWGYYRPDEVRVATPDALSVYAPSGINKHFFCSSCGGNMFGSSPDWASIYNADGTLKEGATDGVPAAEVIGVNLRMVDGLDLSTLDVEQVDGRNNW